MRFVLFLLFAIVFGAGIVSCDKTRTAQVSVNENQAGVRIAYVNGDSIQRNYKEWRMEADAMKARQEKAEGELQRKGAALEKEFMAYQQQAQKGTMTGKEMEAREKYLSGKQQAILAERDKMAKEMLDATDVINERLQKTIHGVLEDIKKKEGYDFILSYLEGGPILIADEKYDITEQVVKALNDAPVPESTTTDTTAKK